MATATQLFQVIPESVMDNTSHVQDSARNNAARQLLKRWREEEQSETNWSDVQQLIEENRLSVRRKFGE